jgi:hypothetical protein
MVTVVKNVFGARLLHEPEDTNPLMQPVEWQGQIYFTTRYFHQLYLAHMAEQGRKVTHKRHDNFLRVVRAMPIYHLLVERGDIVELLWTDFVAQTQDMSFEGIALRRAFEAVKRHRLILLNATAQLELTHHLDDEPSKTLAYVQNKLVAEVLTVPALQQIKQTTEVIKALRDLVGETRPCVPPWSGARAPVAMCWCQADVEGVRGPGLRSLVSPADPPPLHRRERPAPGEKHA